MSFTEAQPVDAEVSALNGHDPLLNADPETRAKVLRAREINGLDVDDTPVTQPEEEQHVGQVRMAYRLAAAYTDRLMHVYGLGWFHWTGQRWQEDQTGRATRAVLTVLRAAHAEGFKRGGQIGNQLVSDAARCNSHNGIAGVLGIASALKQFAVTVADLDQDPYLLNCANGTFDLRTQELRPAQPSDRITKQARAAYAPNMQGSTWLTFIERILPDPELRAFVQRLGGATLLGKVRDHILPILTGTGANGKGCFYGGTLHALGDYGIAAEKDLFLHRPGGHPTGEMDLRGIRLAVVAENDKNARLAEATMKRLTGGDPIRARRMHKDYIQFDPTHLVFLVTNHLPRVSGDDEAIWRRLRVVPFNVVIPRGEWDLDLPDKLQLAADEVLGWLIEGYRQYVERGLDEPDAVLVATKSYRDTSDDIGRFISEACVVGDTVRATTKELFTAWEAWRTEDGAKEISSRAFGLALDARGYVASNPVHGKRWRHDIGLTSENVLGVDS